MTQELTLAFKTIFSALGGAVLAVAAPVAPYAAVCTLMVEYFAPRGAEASIVEMMPIIGNGIDPVSKIGTFDLMEKHGVKQLVNTALLEVKERSFLVKNPDGSEEELPFDYGFVCLGMRANNPILDQLRESFDSGHVEIMNIGDSVRARRIIEGTEEGRDILNVLDKRDFI